MRLPLLTRGMPGRGNALLFDQSLAPNDGERLSYLTLHAANLSSAPADCTLVLEGEGLSARLPIALLPLGELGAPRPIVHFFPMKPGDVVRWEGPDDVVVMGYLETHLEESVRTPEPLRSEDVGTAPGAPYGIGDSIVSDAEKRLHTFRDNEQLTLGVDVPAGQTLELIFRPEAGDEVRLRLPGPLVAYELYERVPIGAPGTLLGRVVTGGAAIVYGCLVRS